MGSFDVVCVAECLCALTRLCCGRLVQPVPITSVCQCVERREQPPVAKATFQMQLFHRLKVDSLVVLLLVQPTKRIINLLNPESSGKKVGLTLAGNCSPQNVCSHSTQCLSPLMGLQTWLPSLQTVRVEEVDEISIQLHNS